jgi:hypothetical protein
MKIFAKISKFLLVLVLITVWIFDSWPTIFNFPPEIQKAEAAINQTTYLSSTASTKITSTVSWQIVATAPASSNVATSCKYAKTIGYCQETPGAANATNGQAKPTAPNGKGWIYNTPLDSTIPAGTWTFNIRTTNSAAGGTGYMAVCAWKVKIVSEAISSSVNIINCVDGTTNLQANTTSLYASSVSVTSVPAVSFAADEYLYVEYWLHTTAAGSSSTAKLTFEANAGASDDIVLPGASSNLAPNAPSQDSPANGATGVSVTPTFLMTATDPENDNLGYKVTIYSDSACTTIVGSAHDQSTNSTGWTGTDATCTNNPTSCYKSGTQGSFTLQSADALSYNTQYWWKASAKDPDGSNTFTNSSTCNTFTTVAATVSVSVSDGAISYGTIPANSTKSTCTSELNDAQTVTNNGNVNENFLIRGQNSANWTLAATAGTDQYVHKFLNGACSTFSGGTALTTSDQSFATGISPSGTATLNLQMNTPNPSTVYTQQSVDVTITAVQQ